MITIFTSILTDWFALPESALIESSTGKYVASKICVTAGKKTEGWRSNHSPIGTDPALCSISGFLQNVCRLSLNVDHFYFLYLIYYIRNHYFPISISYLCRNDGNIINNALYYLYHNLHRQLALGMQVFMHYILYISLIDIE